MIEAISLAAGLAWASGVRLYLTALLTGFCGLIGACRLPDGLHFLASPWALAPFALLAAAEFLADKVPAFDSLWDALHTFIRIPAGALLAAAVAGRGDPLLATAAGLFGAMLAGTAHLTKAGARALINLSPEPLSNWAASAAEDVLCCVGVLLALFFPLPFIALLTAFLLAAGWALPRLWRGVQGGWRGMAAHLVRAAPPSHRPRDRRR